MIITACREEGIDRVYVTRFASITTYFTEDEESGGVMLHVEPGLFSYPSEFLRHKDAVRAVILSDVAQRLGVGEQDVLRQSFSSLKEIADPVLPEHYRYAKRTKNRAYPFR